MISRTDPMKKHANLLRQSGLILLLLVAAVSCRGKHGRYIIPEKKFLEVLVDIHLADGMAMDNMRYNEKFVFDSASLYESVFSKHEVTREQFDSTMQYYSAHPDDFQELYNILTSRLKRMEDDLRVKQDTMPREVRE
jgi:hypothetical protein